MCCHSCYKWAIVLLWNIKIGILGMELHILGDIFFTNLLKDPYNEYMIRFSHISGEDNVTQAQVFSQMSPP